jgi:hypothetical protein
MSKDLLQIISFVVCISIDYKQVILQKLKKLCL